VILAKDGEVAHSFQPLLGVSRSFFSGLIEPSGRSHDRGPQRIALYREVERLVLDDAPWIPQRHYVLNYLYQPYVQGVEVSLLGERVIPLKKIWLKQRLAEDSAGSMTDVRPSP